MTCWLIWATTPCEADTLGSYGHVYLAIYSATEAMNETVTFNQGGI
ncbi:type IV toxin-antitoxin system YeeU family antitoxin [Aeromonas hydrophila]